ncbi:hypothetical protein, partial [Rhizobium sp. AP16]|uniref:hypothetical protein n=1 Tax=Rhizobium sp. AP16 TaxID=1144306 RepID=UPI002869BF59
NPAPATKYDKARIKRALSYLLTGRADKPFGFALGVNPFSGARKEAKPTQSDKKPQTLTPNQNCPKCQYPKARSAGFLRFNSQARRLTHECRS